MSPFRSFTIFLIFLLSFFEAFSQASVDNPYDADGDGLIEVHTVEQLNVIRYDLNGDGEIDDTTSNDPSVDDSKAAAYVAAFHGVLPPDEDSYVGYELAAALTFAGSEWSSAAGGEGWEPIGDNSNQYTATFAGNNHTITGLYINRPDTDYVGLFGRLEGSIRHVGLEEVSVLGDENVGGLMGYSDAGRIVSTYVTGTVSGNSSVGGLVGYAGRSITSSYATADVIGNTKNVGGLVGENAATITLSYATGTVTGGYSAGGLVGENAFATITSSYATGNVTGSRDVGGLVGNNISTPTIRLSYATGDVKGSEDVGGLVGRNIGGTITSSYYSSAAAILQGGAAVASDAYARSVAELLSVPTADAPGIFESWAVDAERNSVSFDDHRIVWDFGVALQYPALKVDFDFNGTYTVAEFGTQPRFIAGTYVDFLQLEFIVGEEDSEVVVSVVMSNAPADAVTITVLLEDGTATSPGDYTRDGGTIDLSFDSSSAVDFLTTATFTIRIMDDSLLEDTETIALSFDDLPEGVGLVGPSASKVVIVDDELRRAYDADGDGLIEVYDLEQLSVIRCDLDGDGEIDDLTSNDPDDLGSKAFTYVRAFGYGFCPPDEVTYAGYELAAALDFAGTRWALDATDDGIPDAVFEGWEPIGSGGSQYISIFNGNSHTIMGLCINRRYTDDVGLFGYAGASAIIRNVFLEEVYVLGDDNVGSLVGYNEGTIASSCTTGMVAGGNRVGGLMGHNEGTITSSYTTGTVMGGNRVGGLVGYNFNGTITSSYAVGTVMGADHVGGLVGSSNASSTIRSSYAVGDVTGTEHIGGLVGGNFGSITSSYATGSVTGDSRVGGLVGHNFNGTITSSYYSSAAVVLQDGDAVPPDQYVRLVVELARVPTADAPGIFEDWAVDAIGNSVSFDAKRIVWDFGTGVQYPVLCPVDADRDGIFTSAEFGTQPRDLPAYVYFSQSEFVVNEENGAVEVSVVMFNAPADAVTVTVLCSGDTATPSEDYVRGSGTIPHGFAASSAVDFLATSTFTIPIIDDKIFEDTETIALSFDTLPEGVALAVPSTAMVFIVDDELRRAYDADGNGLIEVHNLEQLSVIRCDLDGDGEIDDLDSNNLSDRASKASIYVAAFGYGDCPPDEESYVGYELAADLDFAGSRWMRDATLERIPDAVAEGWEPIGTSAVSQFTATFEGNDHTITGLCINRPDTDYVGLFGYAGASAIIRNVGLEEVRVLGFYGVGGLVGISEGAITSSYATGSVTGFDTVGGLVGYSDSGSTITSSYATGTVDSGDSRAGGLVAISYGDITSSYSTGAVMGDSFVGGLVGFSEGAITSSYATGDVTGSSSGNGVGGLVGFNNDGTITSSYATGDASGRSGVGGLVGQNSGGTITSSYYSSAAVVLLQGTAVEPDAYVRSAVELARVPTADTPGLFEDWAVDAAGNAYTLDDNRIVWDFGANAQYPVLCPVDANGDGRFTSAEFGMQPRDIEGVYVYFSQSEFVVDEANGAATVSVVMINAPADAVTVTVLCSDGTAMSPNDYTRGSGTVDLSFDSFSAVDLLTTATFTIPIIDDNTFENTETIALSLDADTLPAGVTLADRTQQRSSFWMMSCATPTMLMAMGS